MATFKHNPIDPKVDDWKLYRQNILTPEQLIETGLMMSGITVQEFNNLEMQWRNYIFQLEIELPEEKRKEIMLEVLQTNYKWEKDKLDKLEKMYEESRKKDEPYKIRRRITEQAEIVKEMNKATEKEIQLKRSYSLDWIDPMSHYHLIQEIGIENFWRKYCQLGFIL